MSWTIAAVGTAAVLTTATVRSRSTTARLGGLAAPSRSKPSSRSTDRRPARAAPSTGRSAMRTSATTGPALLGEPGLLDAGGVAAVEVGGHLEDPRHGDDAGAADAGHADEGLPVGRPQRRCREVHRRCGQSTAGPIAARLVRRPASGGAGGSAPRRDHDERRAVAVEAREVLVARTLVDGGLAAEVGLDRERRTGRSTCVPQSPQPSQTRWLIQTAPAGSAACPACAGDAPRPRTSRRGGAR